MALVYLVLAMVVVVVVVDSLSLMVRKDFLAEGQLEKWTDYQGINLPERVAKKRNKTISLDVFVRPTYLFQILHLLFLL